MKIINYHNVYDIKQPHTATALRLARILSFLPSMAKKKQKKNENHKNSNKHKQSISGKINKAQLNESFHMFFIKLGINKLEPTSNNVSLC